VVRDCKKVENHWTRPLIEYTIFRILYIQSMTRLSLAIGASLMILSRYNRVIIAVTIICGLNFYFFNVDKKKSMYHSNIFPVKNKKTYIIVYCKECQPLSTNISWYIHIITCSFFYCCSYVCKHTSTIVVIILIVHKIYESVMDIRCCVLGCSKTSGDKVKLHEYVYVMRAYMCITDF